MDALTLKVVLENVLCLNKDEAAEALGVDPNMVRRWKSGKLAVPPWVVERLADWADRFDRLAAEALAGPPPEALRLYSSEDFTASPPAGYGWVPCAAVWNGLQKRLWVGWRSKGVPLEIVGSIAS